MDPKDPFFADFIQGMQLYQFNLDFDPIGFLLLFIIMISCLCL